MYKDWWSTNMSKDLAAMKAELEVPIQIIALGKVRF